MPVTPEADVRSQPLSSPPLQRSSPSISQQGPPRGAHGLGLSPQCSARSLERTRAKSYTRGPATSHAPTAPRISPTDPTSIATALCRHPWPGLLCISCWAGCPALPSSILSSPPHAGSEPTYRNSVAGSREVQILGHNPVVL